LQSAPYHAFSRPVEYDPDLAQAQAADSASAPLSKADALKDEFGFEESDEDEQTDDGADDGAAPPGGAGGANGYNEHDDGQSSRGGGGGMTRRGGRGGLAVAEAEEELRAELEAQHQLEVDRLAEALAEAQERAARSEDLARRTEERLEELSQMSKQAKNILVSKFRSQLKTLMAQVRRTNSKHVRMACSLLVAAWVVRC
jgi:hypothetical protein